MQAGALPRRRTINTRDRTSPSLEIIHHVSNIESIETAAVIDVARNKPGMAGSAFATERRRRSSLEIVDAIGNVKAVECSAIVNVANNIFTAAPQLHYNVECCGLIKRNYNILDRRIAESILME